jgi:hypothetical protein
MGCYNELVLFSQHCGWRFGAIMNLETILIQVDSEAANIYRSASEADRRKLNLLLSLRLRDAARSGSSLEEVMDEISQNAQRRGLTPELLQEILNER